MGKTGIEWTDESSNPLRYRDATGKDVWACVKTSPGCKNCYAEALATRFAKGGSFTKATQATVTPYLHLKEVRRLLTSTALSGKRVFTCDMTDLFGDWVSNEMIAALFAVFAARPDVTFQLLTKRAARLLEWFRWVESRPVRLTGNATFSGQLHPRYVLGAAARAAGITLEGRGSDNEEAVDVSWPLPNVWLGVSVETQKYADARIPHLLRTPAAVRFVSLEPLLDAVNVSRYLPAWLCEACGHFMQGRGDDGVSIDEEEASPCCSKCGSQQVRAEGLSWGIVGGESGPGARPLGVGWAKSLVVQFCEANVPVFVKQLGTRPMCEAPAEAVQLRLRSHKGGDPGEWPSDLRVRLFPLSPRQARVQRAR